MPSFSPCGCVVDLLRSCYTTKMSFFPNRPDLLTPVRWFFTDPGAAVLPFPTKFASGNWAEQKWTWPGVGEVLPRDRRWKNGANFDGEPGLVWCGTPEQFFNGDTYPPPPFPRTSNGAPYCCFQDQLILDLGLDGTVVIPTCDQLWTYIAETYPGSMAQVFSGFSDFGSCLGSNVNGPQTLFTIFAGCNYRGDVAAWAEIDLSFNADTTTSLLFYGGPFGAYANAEYTGVGSVFDGPETIVYTLQGGGYCFGTPNPGFPPTITLSF
jgi:hypothetical protein